METLAYLHHAEAYAAKVKDPLKAIAKDQTESIAKKSSKKSRKKDHPAQPTNAQEFDDIAFSWMP